MQQNVTFRSAARALVSSLALGLFLAPLAPLAQPAHAQGLFAPAITVNEDVITTFELNQRALFLNILGAQGDLLATARRDLIEERLKQAAVKEVGLSLPEEEISAGMAELAGRAGLALEDFLAQLKQVGIVPQTLRDYTAANLSWRDYIRARFLSRARPSEDEIDRAMGTAGAGGVQVLLSEIIMPITQANAPQIEELAVQISELKTPAAFAASAAQFSAADTRTDGGRLPWMPLGRLPGPLQEVVLELEVNEITDPLPMQGAVALFQMRGLREITGSATRFAAIEYATYRIPGGRSAEALSRAAQIRDEIDTCDDLYGIAKGQPPEVLFRDSLAPKDIPQDIALELAKLDPGESTANVTRDDGQTLLLVMLCGRTAEINLSGEDARTAVANGLVQQRLNAMSDSLVEQMRANARIDYK